jgi:hypothetical protein
MSRVLQRAAVAYVNDVAIEKLRMTFKSERHIKKDPNSLELNITNLSRSTLSRIQTRHATVAFAAGYQGSLVQIFKGTAKSILPTHSDKDWVTKVVCGDGGTAYSYGRTNQSFPPGAKTTDVLQGVLKQAGVGIGNAIQAFQKGGLDAALQSFTHGFTASGSAQSDIDTIMRTAGFTWSIQDGELQVLTADNDFQGQVEDITPDTGLVGSPEMGSSDKKGGAALLKVKCLLRPQIKPGVAFQVQSEAFPTPRQFRAEKVTHEGDTWAGDWFTTIEGRAL